MDLLYEEKKDKRILYTFSFMGFIHTQTYIPTKSPNNKPWIKYLKNNNKADRSSGSFDCSFLNLKEHVVLFKLDTDATS